MRRPGCLRMAGLVGVVLVGMCVPPEARADLPALRVPLLERVGEAPRRALVVAPGYPDASVAALIAPHVVVALSYKLPFDAVGAAAAWRGSLAGGATRWGLDLVAGGGVEVPTLRPGVALTAMVSLAGRVRTDRVVASLGVVAPIAVRLAPVVESKLPVLLDLWLGVRAGPVLVGLQAAGGASLSVGGSPELTGQASLFVAVPVGAPLTPGAAPLK